MCSFYYFLCFDRCQCSTDLYLTRLLASSPSFIPKQNLLAWLLAQKAKGYYIVGLEQTSSSISLEELTFPDQPMVLLLGKEKEGIPVEFLQAVDQCVEIPQLGIIRSLNVHVSGAICIWEITKQRLAKGL
jgi:tRNA guanosine-2'-O-methyltransferase